MRFEKKIGPLIELNYGNFTPAEKGIADFFLQNTELMDFSAKNIAKRLFTSEATLSRFAQKCGFDGYRQFIYSYREGLRQEKDSQVGGESRHILETYQELLNKSYALVDESQIKRVSKLIAEKRRILVYGKGSSGFAAEELRMRLMRLGVDIESITDSHIMTMSSAIVNEDALAIGITVSGKTNEVVRSVKTAKSKGASTAIISSVHLREWDAYCDEVLPLPTKEKLVLGKLISPQFPVLVLCDLLFTNVLQYDRMNKEALHELTLSELNMIAPTDKII
ncbi:MAG: MurR/RpiR family transcriptional regulator [Clostridiales bacterium]|nr:MurR/RpiR family transcriptional regulator [Clostridiales bacterium]